MRKVNLQMCESSLYEFQYMCSTRGLNFSMVSPVSRNRTISQYTVGLSEDNIVSLGENRKTAEGLAISSDSDNVMMTTCRELITNQVRKARSGVYSSKYRLDKFRLAVFDTYPSDMKSTDFINVVKSLNMIEKAKGWKLTYPYEINFNCGYATSLAEFTTSATLFIAPKQWIASPYMTSLYLLLIRIIIDLFRRGLLKRSFNNIDEINDKIKSIGYSGSIASYDDTYMDIHMLLGSKRKDWRILINHFEEIHKGNKKQYWLSGIDNTDGYYTKLSRLYTDGLDKLLKGVAFNKTIGGRFEKIANKV